MNYILLLSFVIIVGGDVQRGKLYRIFPDETIYNCDRSPPNENYKNFLNLDNLLLDQIDENLLDIGGEVKMMYDFNSAPIQVFVKSEFLSKGSWVEGLLRYYTLNICSDFRRTDLPWYNLTKVWSELQCPPHKGDIWKIEQQSIELALVLPQNMPIGPWRISYTVTQEGHIRSKFCFNVRFDLFPSE